MFQTSKDFKHDHKCMLCKRGKSEHRAKDYACPIGQRNRFPQFAENGEVFSDSGKPTIRSNKALKNILADEERQRVTREIFEAEKNKIRSMTFDQVVAATQRLLTVQTGLKTLVEKAYVGSDDNVEIHLLAGGMRLGWISVTKYSNGSYGVAGSCSGCFMSNHNGEDIASGMKGLFEALEESANTEKIPL